MNLRLVARLLGMVAWLTGGAMLYSVPWASPLLGQAEDFEVRGMVALMISIAVCAAVGYALRWIGRGDEATLFRKEAMATVGLSWILATVLGALPFWLSETARGLDADGKTPVPMTWIDCMFESQSGFSTTGATVLTRIEDPRLVPRCILFWRSSTHFLGGLGIIVLFVAILGQGSAGKAMMRAEMPGPTKEGAQTRMQHTAWTFAGIYCALNAVLAVILMLEGLSLFDALCHAFGTMATGGFSTFDASLGHFRSLPELNAPIIEYTVVVFMVLAGTNFTLLYFLLLGRPQRLIADVEWRTYIGVMAGVTALVIAFGLYHEDFETTARGESFAWFEDVFRYSLFQVVSIMTTTGFGTHNFDAWNSFGRGVLFLLMFVGGCAGSTGGGIKVIRHILFLKVLRLEVEQSFHPSVVRPLRLRGQPVEDPSLRKQVLVYFCLVLAIFVFSWMFLVAVEPDATWISGGQNLQNKLIDSASSVAATLNNIGPGLGIVGATENYARFTPWAKLLFIFLMMLGRLELFAILVLFIPRFWQSH
jgi:trk system potassium uptake protein TrkH